MQNIDLTPILNDVLLGVSAMDDNPKLKSAHLYNGLSLLKTSLGEGAWVGLYLVQGEELILGPFQGTMACETIPFGKGVVGECYARKTTIAVKDVRDWPNYICCDASAQSEICVPIEKSGTVIAVLDIDLPYPHVYDEEKSLFEQVAEALSRFC